LLYILFGADDFSLRVRLEELKQGWGDKESLSINTTFFEAPKLTPSQLLSTCDSAPFLGENRLVIIEGCSAASSERRHPPPGMNRMNGRS
jgi:DNA polymerase III delta subunit